MTVRVKATRWCSFDPYPNLDVKGAAMSKNTKQTSSRIGRLASETLQSSSSSQVAKSLAASALSQRSGDRQGPRWRTRPPAYWPVIDMPVTQRNWQLRFCRKPTSSAESATARRRLASQAVDGCQAPVVGGSRVGIAPKWPHRTRAPSLPSAVPEMLQTWWRPVLERRGWRDNLNLSVGRGIGGCIKEDRRKPLIAKLQRFGTIRLIRN